jgi:hypothetical protein
MGHMTYMLCKLSVLACNLVLVCLLSSQAGIMVAGLAEAGPASGPPNILFIIMDEVGIDQMRVFGYGEDNQPRTPNIDAVARAGVRFRNAWAMPECSPSRVSFFTGRYPLRTGVLNISATRDLANSQASPVDVYQLFGEVAGIDVRQVVPHSHALDARSMLPYLTVPGQESIRKSNFTQTGTNLQAPGSPIPPCVIEPDALNVCVQVFPFQALCETEEGVWYGPGGAAGAAGVQTCRQVQTEFDPTVSLLAHDAWAVRDNDFKLVRRQIENCQTNQLEQQYEFYAINDAAPLPKLDREQDNLLTSTSLPPQGLSPDEQKHFDVLLAELLALLHSEPACPGDGNLDKRVNAEDLQYWQVFADTCEQNQNQCSSIYDLNYDAVTDSADRVVIEANLGRRCGVRGFLR